MTAVEPGVIQVRYTDQWSAFDRGPSEQLIPGIGAARCACAVKSFQLAAAADVQTHFIEQVDHLTILVKEFGVEGQPSLSGKVHGRVTPLEWIWRMYLKGKLWERVRLNKISLQDLGFARGAPVIEEGMKLPRLFMECSTKLESRDRLLTDVKARAFAHLTREQWDSAWEVISEAIRATNAAYARAGFRQQDGKLELAVDENGDIVIVDVFGTPDEDRIIELATGEMFSKDLLREKLKHFEHSRWYVALIKAADEFPNDKSKWPPYPKLSADFVDMMSARYAEVARRYEAA